MMLGYLLRRAQVSTLVLDNGPWTATRASPFTGCARDTSGVSHFFEASTPSPIFVTENPAFRNRFATSFATSRPLLNLLGVPV